jgi:hypothetical protein
MDVREKLVEIVRNLRNRITAWHTAGDIADLLISNGVTVLPCKIGDVVWGIKKYNNGQEVKQGVVHQMYFGEDMRLCVCVKNVCRGEWGVNVFLAKDEAESHLPQPPKGE